jgi:hypothetical protein
VVAPALAALRNTVEVVSFCLAAIEKYDLSVPPPIGEVGMELSFATGATDVGERRNAHKHWILKRGFHELTRGVRLSLEEAYLYVEVTKLQGATTWGRLQKQIADIKRDANKWNFPTLIDRVNCDLSDQLTFKNEYLSLNKVRNCLEHRDGVVGAPDLQGSEALMLSLPRMMIFYLKDGAEVELARGDRFEKDTEVLVKRTIKKSHYGSGDRISFTGDEFRDISMACWFFAQDLASKLPRPQSAAAAEVKAARPPQETTRRDAPLSVIPEFAQRISGTQGRQ